MNWVDAFLIAALILSAVAGWRRGLITEIMVIAGIVVAFLAAATYGPRAVALILGLTTVRPQLAAIVSFGTIFLVVLVLFHGLARFLRKLLRLSPGALLDALGGAGLGLATGIVLLSLALMAATALPLSERTAREFEGSKLTGPVRQACFVILGQVQRIVPESTGFVSALKGQGEGRTGGQGDKGTRGEGDAVTW